MVTDDPDPDELRARRREQFALQLQGTVIWMLLLWIAGFVCILTEILATPVVIGVWIGGTAIMSALAARRIMRWLRRE